jgi:hypothetical protein
VAGFGGGFAAVFRLFVGVAVAGEAGDDAAGAAEAAGFGMGGAALDTADPAVFSVVGEHGFAVVGGVSVAVGGAGRAILEASNGFWIGGICASGLRVGGLAGAVCRDRHWHASSTAVQTQNQTR